MPVPSLAHPQPSVPYGPLTLSGVCFQRKVKSKLKIVSFFVSFLSNESAFQSLRKVFRFFISVDISEGRSGSLASSPFLSPYIHAHSRHPGPQPIFTHIMSANIWSVLNNVADDTENGKIKLKKPANNRAPGKGHQQQKKPAADSNKPQLTEKAARAFRDGQKPKQPKQQPTRRPPTAAAPKDVGPAMVVKKPSAAAPIPTQQVQQQF